MKKAFAYVLTLLISTGLIIKAYSADIDGIDKGYEWDGSTSYVFINGESNCGIDFAVMKLKVDNENRAVYFCFLINDPKLEKGNLQTGVSLSIDNSQPFVFTTGTTPDEYDVNKYNFNGAITIDENNGATCEVRLGIKSGLPKTINGLVRFIDAEGLPSNEYIFSLVNEGYIDWTATEIKPTADNDDPIYNPGLMTEKTNSSKKTTYKNESNKTTERKKRGTTSTTWKYTTDEFVIKTSPPYSYIRTTNKSENSSAREKIEDKKSNNYVTVYYYEKEVVISEVYNQQENKIIGEEKNYLTSIHAKSDATENYSDNSLQSFNQSVSLSAGMKYKYVVGAVAATMIVLLAAWSARGDSKSNRNVTDESE